jgi:THO complex subunit 1
VTTFDSVEKGDNDEADGMDVDLPDVKEETAADDTQTQQSESQTVVGKDDKLSTNEVAKTPLVTVSQPGVQNGEKPLDLDALYPIFWGLQAYFSAPTKIFDSQHFATFKTGLESTLSAFKTVNTELETSNSKTSEEIRKSNKRKRTTDGPEIASSFNPKYLTSRELFDLEVFL